MHGVHLSGVDLNLLVVLDALLTEGHVTRAARRVGLSQSAASHALGRLRSLLGDPLFVRSGRRLAPTPRAEALREPVRVALTAAAAALLGAPRFDPARAERTFRVVSGDLALLAVLPALVARVAREAPRVDLTFLAPGADPYGGLERADADLVIGPLLRGERGAGVRHQELFAEAFVCMMRRGHPLGTKRKLTLDAYCAASHALIAPGGTPGGIVDDALARLGRSRRVAVRVPHFLVAPFVVGGGDLLLTLPERVATTLARNLDVVLLPPPLRVPGFTMAMFWHERTTDDPAHGWLRSVVERACASLRGPLRGVAAGHLPPSAVRHLPR
jgi:DNA-binding transcriptional LysR family regulator